MTFVNTYSFAALSQDLRLLAAQASERVACNSSPSDFLDKTDQNNSIEPQTGPAKKDEKTKVGGGPSAFSAPSRDSSEKPRRVAHDKAKRKSNELGRLLSDLTDGIFYAEVNVNF